MVAAQGRRSAREGARGKLRRLITLIFAGRNRIVMIRRELPRTEDAGWVVKPYRTKVRRILLSVSSRPITCAASAMSSLSPPLLNCPDDVSCLTRRQSLPNFVSRHLIRLHPFREMDHLHRAMSPQLD